MLELDELKAQMKTYEEPMQQMRSSLDLDNKEKRIEELERTMAEPGFWENPENAQKLQKELGSLRNGIEAYSKLENLYEETLMMIDMANEDEDESVLPDIRSDMDAFREDFESMRIRTLLSGPYDANDAIVTLHSGAGGTEACDWCGMLYRMYSRWIDKKGLSMEILDSLDGDEAGIKSITFQVNGENAYGLLKSEMGIHRLVRISPFNAAGKRQTSFVSCDVMPDIEEDVDIEVKDEDIRIDTYRSSGAKDKAMQMLKARLLMLKMEENREKAAGIRGEVKEIGWGSQIRSYVFQPYTMVKDLRTGQETGNVQAVMDGDLDPFIDAYLKWDSLGRPDRKAMSAD